MALKRKDKNLPFLFLTGTVSLFYSTGYIFITRTMPVVVILLGIIGLLSLILCVLKLVKPYQWKRVLYISISALVSIIVLILINYVAYKHDVRWDVTYAKQHTLSKETEKYIHNLDKDIKLTAFYVGIPPKYLQDMFQEYERVSDGKITTEIIDPLVDIGYASKFGSVIDGKKRKVFIEERDNKVRKEVDFSNEPLSEGQLTNGIIRAIRKESTVYFLTGHGEYRIGEDNDTGLSKFVKLLAENNIISKQLLLVSTNSIPDDCDLLVIPGPKEFLTKKEDDIIEKYLEDGGDALFLIENIIITTPDKPLKKDEMDKNPSLNEILKNWGVKVEKDVVVDLSSHASGDVGSPATRNYLSHTAIVGDLDYTFYVRPRSISMDPNRRRSLRIAPLVVTASMTQSWGETDRTLNVKFDPGVDRQGNVPIAYVIMELKEKGEKSDTRIAVFTDADFLSNLYIDYYSNAQMGINIVNWLLESDYKTFAGHKDIKVETLDLTSAQKRMIAVVLCLMPLLVIVVGLFTWIRQKTA